VSILAVATAKLQHVVITGTLCVALVSTSRVFLPAGVVFFALVLFSAPLEPTLAVLGLTPLYAAVLVGAAQNIFSKSSKYSLFDPCKEMAYIPLDQETKVSERGRC
jgi:AAA family ATP:ADP antiporter